MSTPADLSASLLRGATLSVGIRVSGLALAFLAQVLISRLSGADSYGIYMYCFAWLAFLLVFTRSGTDEALVRYLPDLAGDAVARRAVIEWSLTRTVYPAWLLMLLLLAFAAGLYFLTADPRASVIATVALFIPILTLLWIYQARLRASHRTFAAFLPNEILRPMLLIVLLAAVVWNGVQPSVTFLLWLSLAATTTAVALMAWYARVSAPGRPLPRSEDIRIWNRTANHFFLIALCLVGTTTIDLMVVGTVLEAEATGHYAAAQRLASLAGFGAIAINLIIAPMLPPLLGSNREAGVRDGRTATERLLRLGSRVATLFVLVVGTTMWLLRDPLLRLFGDGFEVAGIAFGILLLGQLVLAISGSLITLMMMSGHERPALVVIAGCGALNLVLCSSLTLMAGLVGAASAILMTTIIQQAGLWLLARKALRIRTDCF